MFVWSTRGAGVRWWPPGELSSPPERGSWISGGGGRGREGRPTRARGARGRAGERGGGEAAAPPGPPTVLSVPPRSLSSHLCRRARANALLPTPSPPFFWTSAPPLIRHPYHLYPVSDIAFSLSPSSSSSLTAPARPAARPPPLSFERRRHRRRCSPIARVSFDPATLSPLPFPPPPLQTLCCIHTPPRLAGVLQLPVCAVDPARASTEAAMADAANGAPAAAEYVPESILITGGCGFIASHVVNRLSERYPHYKVRSFRVWRRRFERSLSLWFRLPPAAASLSPAVLGRARARGRRPALDARTRRRDVLPRRARARGAEARRIERENPLGDDGPARADADADADAPPRRRPPQPTPTPSPWQTHPAHRSSSWTRWTTARASRTSPRPSRTPTSR